MRMIYSHGTGFHTKYVVIVVDFVENILIDQRVSYSHLRDTSYWLLSLGVVHIWKWQNRITMEILNIDGPAQNTTGFNNEYNLERFLPMVCDSTQCLVSNIIWEEKSLSKL